MAYEMARAVCKRCGRWTSGAPGGHISGRVRSMFIRGDICQGCITPDEIRRIELETLINLS